MCKALALRVHTYHRQASCASVSRVGDISMQVDKSKLRKVLLNAWLCSAPRRAAMRSHRWLSS